MSCNKQAADRRKCSKDAGYYPVDLVGSAEWQSKGHLLVSHSWN